MNVASFVISCLAALAAVGSALYARGQKLVAQAAVAEAKRSADAAAEVAAIEKARRDDELAESERGRVRFVLMHEGGSRWILQNVGTDTAYGVHVDTGDLGVGDETTDFDEIVPDETHRFFLSMTMGATTEHVVVTWHLRPDRSDDPQRVKLLAPLA